MGSSLLPMPVKEEFLHFHIYIYIAKGHAGSLIDLYYPQLHHFNFSWSKIAERKPCNEPCSVWMRHPLRRF